MVSEVQEFKFCSECKYAKEQIYEDGIKIICMRLKNPSDVKSGIYRQGFTVFKKINAFACGNFVAKSELR